MTLTKAHKWTVGIVVSVLCALIPSLIGLFSGTKTTQAINNEARANVSVQVAAQPTLEKEQTIQAPETATRKRVPKAVPPSLTIEAPVEQSAMAPCSGNAIGGSVDLSNWNASVDPYQRVVTYSPDGHRQVKSGNDFGVDDSLTRTAEQFQQLMKLGDWQRLLLLDKETRATDPEWPDLNYNDGVANIALCRVAEGTRYLASFMVQTKGAPDYNKMRVAAQRILSDAESQSKVGDCAARRMHEVAPIPTQGSPSK